jgi:hypothetical protein
MHLAAQALISDTSLVTTRKLLAAELTASFGTTDKAIDADGRAAVSAQFARFRAALETCK